MKKHFILSLKLCTIFFMILFVIGCGGNGPEPVSPENEETVTNETNPLKIFPENPILAKDGILQMVAVLEDNAGNPIENNDENPLSIEWSIDDETKAAIDESGLLVGRQAGSAVLSVTVNEINSDKIYTRTIDLKVEIVTVKKVFINPRVAILSQGETKTFTIIGIDKENSIESLESQRTSFKRDSEYVDITKHFSTYTSTIEVKAKKPKGYTFIIPQYEEAGLQITGDPLLIQIQSIPQPNKPSSNLDGGKCVDFQLNGNGTSIALVHSDGDKIYFQHFDAIIGAWAYKDLDKPDGLVYFLKINANDENIKILAVVDDKMIFWQSSNSGGTFARTELETGIDTHNYGDTIDLEYADNNTYILYYNDNQDKELSLITIDEENNIIKDNILTNVKILSLDLNKNKSNELRFILSTFDGLYYVTKQDTEFYKEQVYQWTNIKYASIAYDRRNNPYIAFYKELDEKIIVSFREEGTWQQDTISSINFGENGLDTEDIMFDIKDLSLTVDRYNALRIAIIGGEDVYYLKRYKESTQLKWRIDKLTNGDVGEYLAIHIDNSSRARIFFEDIQLQWIKYWAEPIYFDYRDARLIVGTQDDNIEEIQENKLDTLSGPT